MCSFPFFECLHTQMFDKLAVIPERVQQYIFVVVSCLVVKSFDDNFSMNAAHYALPRSHYKF